MSPRFQALAQAVTITRDEFGIPHVVGPTDAAVVFGLMFAQAEDAFAQIEEDTAFAIGRASELVGDRGIGNDLRFRAFRVEALAREKLRSAPESFRTLAEAFADGLNFFLEQNPEIESILAPYEPWYFLANVDLPAEVDSISTMRVGKPLSSDFPLPWPPPEDDGLFFDAGSNAWAIGPSKSETGHSILFMNPHVGLFGRGQRYECHLVSDEGWNFSGFCILGNPIPHAGFNEHLGWTHTNTKADCADAYRLTLTDEANYWYGTETRPIETWKDTLRIRQGNELKSYTIEFDSAHYGPIVRQGQDEFALRLPLDRWMNYWSQKLAMTKAKTFEEFKDALSYRTLTYSNTTFADDRGNIAFWYGNAIPRRNPNFDWSKPVDGSNPLAEWDGYFRIDELPHVINPASGYVQNCNSSPWGTTDAPDSPSPEKVASFFVRDTEMARAQNSRRILRSSAKFSFENLHAQIFDTLMFTALERIPIILQALADLDEFEEARQILSLWNHRGDIRSVATTLYVETEIGASTDTWRIALSNDPERIRQSFLKLVEELTNRFGTWQVPWGQVNRLQRHRPFGGSAPSWPVPGANSSFGQIFAFTGPRLEVVRWGTGGNSYVALVEFTPDGPRAEAVCGFGQSHREGSPHFVDQASLYAEGRTRPVWRTTDEIATHAERVYHPGS